MTDIPRIRGNVQKMLAQSAPEADIDAYLTSEGITAKQLRAASRPDVNVPLDMVKSLGTGVAEAGIGTVGLPGDAIQLGKAVVNQFGQKLPPGPSATPKPETGLLPPAPLIPERQEIPGASATPKPPTGLSPDNSPLIPGSREVQQYVENNIGKLYQPQSIPGEYARTFGQMVPMAAMPGGVARRAANVAIPAITSETAGQITKGQPNEPYARVAGALLGTPSILGRGVTPLPASAERNRLVQMLNDEGVTSLTAGQRTGSKPLQWLEQTMSDLPLAGKGATQITDRGKEQFTQASLRRVGETATRADDRTMDNAFRRIGGEFDRLAANNSITADAPLQTALQQALREYRDVVAPNSQVPIVEGTLRDIVGRVQQQNGTITGPQYSDMRTRLNRVARETNDATLSRTLFDVQHALDDAMERSLRRSGNTADLEAWQQARREYRNIIPLERAVTGAGAETAEGFVSPSQLRGAVVNQNRRAYARGEGDFADLARSGEAIMKPLPNSGTAPRSFMQAMLAGGLEASTLGAPIIAGRAITSRPMQAYLGNQLLADQLRGSTPKRDALVQLLMAEPRLQLEAPRQ